MAEQFKALTDKHIDFINRQKLFFVGTAGAQGYINVSPKGTDSFRIISPSRVMWLNLTGSGNETAAHVRENGRMTIMFCSFETQPLIMRLYGSARAVHPRDPEWKELYGRFPECAGARQIFELELALVQTSCGFGVPLFRFENERETLKNWIEKTGQIGIEEYWHKKNRVSLDNKDTGILSGT